MVTFGSSPLSPFHLFFGFAAIGFWFAYLGKLNLIFNNIIDLHALTPLNEN